MNPPYRWHHIRELGRGGQGIVSLVLDKTKCDIDNAPQMLATIISNLTGTTTGKRSEHLASNFEKFALLIDDVIAKRDPKSLGALKRLHSPEDARDVENSAARLAKEIKAMTTIKHPHLLDIVDADEGNTWYVSPFHAGGTLHTNIEKFKGDPTAALRALRPVVDGVTMLHRANVVHRDIKPQNIFLGENGLILGDFGLVYFEDEGHTRLSNTFSNVGSRDWMPSWASHQRIEDVKPNFDVFSLGKVLWAMIVGMPSVPQWHLDRELFDIERFCPTDSLARRTKELLRKIVVSEESDCLLADAGELLQEIDAILDAFSASLFQGSGSRVCLVCRAGAYSEVRIADLDCYGLKAAGHGCTTKTFACDTCGHVQQFVKKDEDIRRLWNDL
ncbi:MAG: protein kinase [Pirellulales bacterium]